MECKLFRNNLSATPSSRIMMDDYIWQTLPRQANHSALWGFVCVFCLTCCLRRQTTPNLKGVQSMSQMAAYTKCADDPQTHAIRCLRDPKTSVRPATHIIDMICINMFCLTLYNVYSAATCGIVVFGRIRTR